MSPCSRKTNKKPYAFIHRQLLLSVAAVLVMMVAIHLPGLAQSNNQMVRLAKIKVDPAQLEKYNDALKEQMVAAVKLEPGVLTYYAVADKIDPTNITILEIYADSNAYQTHILTAHFKKYKETVKNMVKSLELVDVNVIGSAKKPGM